MILSDRSIREELAAGRIAITPLDEGNIQPSSVDLRLGRFFRVFLNHTTRVIDVKEDQEDLTPLVEIEDDDVFILHPGEFVLGSTAERVSLPDDLVARLEGKALGVDTPVPTPAGWTTMGALSVGDFVFDERGQPTQVVAATEAMHDRPCRQVEFGDGTALVADAAHTWETVDKNGRRYGRRRARLVTTDDISRTLMVRGERNHQIRLTEPVAYSEKVLPIHPYVLGVWLGDGTSSKAELTCADEPILEELRRVGCTAAPQHHRGRYIYLLGGEGRTRDARSGYVGNGSLWTTLRKMRLLGNKHIPRDYLEASIDQRTALLQGLMDSDGYIDLFGKCEFVNTNEAMADGVFELAASLGLRPTKRKAVARLHGVDCGPKYQVKFTPDRPVFRLPRKLARQKVGSRLHRFRAIAAVRDVPPVPVRCIQVDSPRGLFLVTRAFIPTHNSSLGRLGLLIHSTAGFVDCGFQGHLTLELSNVANLPITLYPGMKIGQISFLRMTTPADRPYGSKEAGSKYQGQQGPTPSRYFENFK